MNKYERVMRVIEGKEADRVPCGFWYHFTEGYGSGMPAVERHMEFFEKSGTDIYKIMNENTCPNDPAINNAEDWSHLKSFSMEDEFIQKQIWLIKNIAERVDHQAVIVATVHGMIASLYHILGGTELYDHDGTIVARHMRENPEGMKHACEVVKDYLIGSCKEFIKAGVDGIYFASLGAEKSMMTDEEFAEFVAPYEIEVLDSINDVPCFNVLHMCKWRLNLERYKDYPARVLNWGVNEENISLIEGRELFGHDKIYIGGLENRSGVMIDGSLEDIKAETRKIINEFGRDKFIIGPDCTLTTDLPYERMQAVVEACK